jgi:hypothetical protein
MTLISPAEKNCCAIEEAITLNGNVSLKRRKM